MKRRFLLGVAAFGYVVSAPFAGNANAATGCFPDTNGHWAETFICWMKEFGITAGYGDGTFRPENSITRAETSVFLKSLSDLQNSQTSGLILVTAGHGDWKPFNSGDDLSFTYFSSSTYVTKATAGSNFLSIYPSIPTVLYGKSLRLLGVELCYAAQANAYLSYVEINKATSAGNRTMLFSDPTDRTDTACRYYVLAEPETLTAEDGLNLFVQAVWTTSTNFNLGRATFVLQTTDVAAAPPSMPQDAVPFDGSAAQADQPSTTPPD